MSYFLIGFAMCNVIQEDSGSQAIQDDEECTNSKGDHFCKLAFAGAGEYFCNDESNKNQCQKTCGICESNKCDNLYDDGTCLSKIQYATYPCMEEDVQKNCMKTCGLCSDYCENVVSHYCTDFWIKRTPYGCNNPKMMILCKRSCGYCPAKACENEKPDNYCEAGKGNCPYSGFMKEKCKKTCGLC